MQSTEDTETIERYRQGDAEALNELVERYRRPLFGFILRMTEGHDDADEIFQEVWFRAIRNLNSYRDNRFFSWLFRIAHNLIIDRIRRRKPEVPIDDEDAADRLFFDQGSTAASPSKALADRELHRRIKAAVGELPLAQREVFLMRMEAELPFKDIADIQRTSINTALARMSYALDKLRKTLAEDYALLNRG
jgi:RNA polymerase sigma-70 factor (ECF subfamily)